MLLAFILLAAWIEIADVGSHVSDAAPAPPPAAGVGVVPADGSSIAPPTSTPQPR